jgi:hypothetical protein
MPSLALVLASCNCSEPPVGGTCQTEDDCPTGQDCVQGKCQAAQPPDAGLDISGRDAGGGSGVPNVNDPNNPRKDTDCDGLSDAEEFASTWGPDARQTTRATPTATATASPTASRPADGGRRRRALPLGRLRRRPATRTSPVEADTDGDALSDGVEDANRDGKRDPGETNPLRPDSDGDGLGDGAEDANKSGAVDSGETNPSLADTDGDGCPDGYEDANRNGKVDSGESDPLKAGDCTLSTADTDGDGLPDNVEVQVTHTDPRKADTDGDGLLDGEEDKDANGVVAAGETDPRSADTDCDGLGDAEEKGFKTDPRQTDSDGDGVPDGVEVGRAGSPDRSARWAATPTPPAAPSPTRRTATATGSPTAPRTRTTTARWTPGRPTPPTPTATGTGCPTAPRTPTPTARWTPASRARSWPTATATASPTAWRSRRPGRTPPRPTPTATAAGTARRTATGTAPRTRARATPPSPETARTPTATACATRRRTSTRTAPWTPARRTPTWRTPTATASPTGWSWGGRRAPARRLPRLRGRRRRRQPHQPARRGHRLRRAARRRGGRQQERPVDSNETDPAQADTDGDGLPDGLEKGRCTVLETRCNGKFVADADCGATKTDATKADTDGDGVPDGAEDLNQNGRVDAGELNPAVSDAGGAVTQACANPREVQQTTASPPTSPWPPPELHPGDHAHQRRRRGGRDALRRHQQDRRPGLRVPAKPNVTEQSPTGAQARLGRGPDLEHHPALHQLGRLRRDGGLLLAGRRRGPEGPRQRRGRRAAARHHRQAQRHRRRQRPVPRIQAQYLRRSASHSIVIMAFVPESLAAQGDRVFREDDLANGTALAQFGDVHLPVCEKFAAVAMPKVDFIWVVDNSGSMNQWQAEVANARRPDGPAAGQRAHRLAHRHHLHRHRPRDDRVHEPKPFTDLIDTFKADAFPAPAASAPSAASPRSTSCCRAGAGCRPPRSRTPTGSARAPRW